QIFKKIWLFIYIETSSRGGFFPAKFLACEAFSNPWHRFVWRAVCRFRPTSIRNEKISARANSMRDRAKSVAPCSRANPRREQLRKSPSPHRQRHRPVGKPEHRRAARRRNRQNLFRQQIFARQNFRRERKRFRRRERENAN